MTTPDAHLPTLEQAADLIFARLGPHLRLATPLGLGKPNQLLNLIYRRVKENPSASLKIYTALSLAVPEPGTEIEERFMGPFLERHFGPDYPRLEYTQDAVHGKMPANIQLHEFYFQAAQMLGKPQGQRHYISLNYTHVSQNIYDCGVNVIVQLIAARNEDAKTRYSLSCNSDLTLDVVDLYRRHGKPLLMVGVVHPDLPFLGGDAEVPGNFFDVIVESAEVRHQLFAPPKPPLDPADYVIGLRGSQLLVDDGTLQIGIGSLSDALVAMTILRHRDEVAYRRLCRQLNPDQDFAFDPFTKGLYGTSEMIMDGFMHLRRHGILKREVLDQDRSYRRYLHGAFFLGSKEFYRWLRELEGDDFNGLSMTRVSKVNDLYDEHEWALRRQRKNARFFNTCMKVTLLGGAASDTLENGQVVSGVGGQYNFVAMSHELPDSLSVLMLRSVHAKNGKRESNIVWDYGQLTIPRHLRDVVITEYGTAWLRGRSDEDCITALVEIADSEFQEELIAVAKKNGKLRGDYKLPERARHNTPESIRGFVASAPELFPAFPFGSDFTPVEEKLALALNSLKADLSPLRLMSLIASGLRRRPDEFRAELERMNLGSPRSIKERLYQKLVIGALEAFHSPRR